jgi:ADP-heptose:LPS heptosyltransferase
VAAFLKGLDLFVVVDGGLFHIAVASGVLTLGLFFKTDPACWKPPVSWATVLRPPDDEPTSLSVDEVYQKVSQMVLKSNLASSF